jgi:glycosyltransferase involved in cell wall biosynthesis
MPQSEAYIKVSNGVTLAFNLLRHAWDGWSIHTHINGHTPKSWLIALAAGLAGQNGTAGILTIHSGIAPEYLRECSETQRNIAHLACRQFDHIICVNEEIARTVQSFGITPERLAVIPAFLAPRLSQIDLPGDLHAWLDAHRPLISTAMFFRPEYGFEVLASGLQKLIQRHSSLGCLVMGSGEERVAAEMLAKQMGLTDCLRFAGDVGHDMCLNLMSRSDLFVRPTFEDGDSISVREALSLGVPVVASNVGTRPAEVRLFEPGNVDELVWHIENVLKTETGETRTAPPCSTAEQLLGIYSSLSLYG